MTIARLVRESCAMSSPGSVAAGMSHNVVALTGLGGKYIPSILPVGPCSYDPTLRMVAVPTGTRLPPCMNIGALLSVIATNGLTATFSAL